MSRDVSCRVTFWMGQIETPALLLTVKRLGVGELFELYEDSAESVLMTAATFPVCEVCRNT